MQLFMCQLPPALAHVKQKLRQLLSWQLYVGRPQAAR